MSPASSLPKYAAIALIVGGCLVLVGWSIDHQPMKAVLSTGVSMNPLTAVLFLLLGAALWSMTEQSSSSVTHAFPAVIALAVIIAGFVRLGSCLSLWSLGIDQFLFPQAVLAEQNVMAPNTALSFMLLGISILFLARGGRAAPGLYAAPALAVMLLAVFALIGYTYHNALFYRVASFIPMAANTALMFLVLSGGILCVRRDDPFMTMVFSRTSGGLVFRTLFPLALSIPWILGWLTVKANLQSSLDPVSAVSFLVLGVIFSLMIVISWTGLLLHRTDSKRQEAEAASAQLAAIVESSDDAIFSKDLIGNIKTWNGGAERLLLYAADEIIGQSVIRLIPNDRLDEETLILERIARGEKTEHLETVRLRKDGTPVEVSLTVSPVRDAAGRPVGAAAIIHDITERKRVEHALRSAHIELERRVQERTAELSQRTRDLETLLYVTSHDLREPLRSIENFSRMVHDRYAERLDDKGKDFLRRVVRGAQRMDRLMADVLALSRAQRMDVSNEMVDGNRLSEEVLRRLEDKIKDVRANVRVSGNLPTFCANGTWATQGLYNLLANALKFTRNGEPPHIEIAPYQSNGHHAEVGFVVRDRGPGVSPDHAERIFQLFQRAVGREVEGTGAGLAIVRQVAERHGGRAWVQPREGGGSEFFLTFGIRSSQKGTE